MSTDHDACRADLAHYWARLMWYRDELWRITIPVWGVYGAFIASCIGYVWSSEKSGRMSGDIALMLIYVIVLFTWVILRMYQIYSHCIYSAIRDLNVEVARREQHIYDTFLKSTSRNDLKSDYGRYRVYPQLHVIFVMIAMTMAFASIFTISAAVGFDFDNKPSPEVVQAVPVASAVPVPAKKAPKTKKPAPAAPIVAIAATSAPAKAAAFTPWMMAGVCFALFAIFEFALWVLHWRAHCAEPKEE